MMNEVNREVIENVLNKMAVNYADFQQQSQERNQYEHLKDKVWAHWYDEYKVQTEFKVGRKYTKLWFNNSVTGFIVISRNDKKFEYGDLLMAASWSAPARNFARGNVFTNMPKTIQWTGV
jgi:hypothetical protein